MTMTKILKFASVPAILVLGVVAMAALGSTRQESNKRESRPEARVVETRRLAFDDVTLAVAGNGVIESERILDLVAEVPGRIVYAKNDLKDGTFVREGEVIVRIDSRDVENQLHGQRSDFMNAVASVLPELQLGDANIWRKWFDYFNSLDIDRTLPDLPEITNAQEKIKVSSRDIIGKYYDVRNQEIRLARHTIRAPFTGYIDSGGVIENSVVSQGQTLLTTSDAVNMVVAVPLLVSETRNIDFSPAPRVTLRAGEGLTKTGRITRKRTAVERNSQTLDVFVTFANADLDPHFLPGNYVDVEIEGRTLTDVATVSRHLLDGQSHVFTMANGKLDREQVNVVAYQGDLAVIENTLPAGTVLVTSVLQKPLVGMEIRSANMPELNPEPEYTEGDGSAESVAADGAANAAEDG